MFGIFPLYGTMVPPTAMHGGEPYEFDTLGYIQPAKASTDQIVYAAQHNASDLSTALWRFLCPNSDKPKIHFDLSLAESRPRVFGVFFQHLFPCINTSDNAAKWWQRNIVNIDIDYATQLYMPARRGGTKLILVADHEVTSEQLKVFESFNTLTFGDNKYAIPFVIPYANVSGTSHKEKLKTLDVLSDRSLRSIAISVSFEDEIELAFDIYDKLGVCIAPNVSDLHADFNTWSVDHEDYDDMKSTWADNAGSTPHGLILLNRMSDKSLTKLIKNYSRRNYSILVLK